MEVDMLARSRDYFSNLNTISQKFAKDIENTKEAYRNLWNTLSEEEQNQVINESIITPAAVLKYAHIQVPIIQDSDTTYTWFTGSQLELLTHFKPSEIALEDNNSTSQASGVAVREVPRKVSVETKKKEGTEESKTSLFGKIQSHKSSILKPKAPPPPPPPKSKVPVSSGSSIDETSSTKHNESNELSGEIRKTGFDFLDNW